METSQSRREFLQRALTGIGLAAATRLPFEPLEALAAQEPDRLARARETLKAIIEQHAAAKDTPWLMIHGVRAMGKGFSVEGRPAVERLCGGFLREKSVGGKTFLHMAIDDEGHTNAFLSEALLDVGITQDYRFQRNGRRHTVGDLVGSSKALFAFDPLSFNRDDLAWSLLAFAHTTDPKKDLWVNAYGTPIRFSGVVEFGMIVLEKATERSRTAMREGTMPTQKDTIHEHTCGGTHLIYGLASCLRFGFRERKLPERMKAQFELLNWRLDADLHLIDRHYQQASKEYDTAMARIYMLDAKMKFLGHALEIFNYARLYRLFTPTRDQERAIKRAEQALAGAIESIGAGGVDKVADQKRLLRLLVGDACHAYHGIRMVKGVNQA